MGLKCGCSSAVGRKAEKSALRIGALPFTGRLLHGCFPISHVLLFFVEVALDQCVFFLDSVGSARAECPSLRKCENTRGTETLASPRVTSKQLIKMAPS